MSAGVHANINGVTRKGKKLYAKVNGVTRPIKEVWVKVNGVSRKIYQSGITWTYTISGNSSQDVTVDSTYAAKVALTTLSNLSGYVTFEFNGGSGFLMHAGQTINLSIVRNGETSDSAVYVNDSDSPILHAYYKGSSNYDENVTYTFTSDILIRTIKIFVFSLERSTESYYQYTRAKVVINSDYGSFLLNSSGKSN